MVSAETKLIIDRAKHIYADRLQKDLESQHLHRFVAIEPNSGDFFLGDTFDEAVESASVKYPARLTHTIRIGHRAAFHIGGATLNGFVDDDLRALIGIPVSASNGGVRTDILVWIDTAFNAGIAIPRSQIAELGLSERSSAAAVLADGNTVELPTFACFLDWFGKSYKTQVVASDWKYPLLGTMLLNGRRLIVDYEAKTVDLS